jgi:RHS repeat-associated protein
MTYDNEGRLATWTAPSGTTASDQFLYDNAGNRVLQRSSSTVNSTTTTTDTIYFDGYTETTITNGMTSTTKYYSAARQTVAMNTGSGWYDLIPDVLGSMTLALNSNGTVKAVQLFAPFGLTRYSDGTMPTSHNFTGQRLDDQIGLLYYNARYYDPYAGQFTSVDSVETNAQGMDPYAYVGGNPETYDDPTGQMHAPGGCGSTCQYDPPSGGGGGGGNGGGGDSGGTAGCDTTTCWDQWGNTWPNPNYNALGSGSNQGSSNGSSQSKHNDCTLCGEHDKQLIKQHFEELK